MGVGIQSDMDCYCGPDTKKVDCQGMTVIPGFNDAHCYPVSYATSPFPNNLAVYDRHNDHGVLDFFKIAPSNIFIKNSEVGQLTGQIEAPQEKLCGASM